jgi:hypothetical protein
MNPRDSRISLFVICHSAFGILIIRVTWCPFVVEFRYKISMQSP